MNNQQPNTQSTIKVLIFYNKEVFKYKFPPNSKIAHI